MPLAENDVKSELSYAYLHGVAAQAGCACQKSDRLTDNLGVDARLTALGDFAPQPSLTEFDVLIQLKATSQDLPVVGNRYSFRIEKSLYDRMRITTVKTQWLLIVLRMPSLRREWLTCSAQALTIKRCAYWVSLRGAPPPAGPGDRLTIYVPRGNRFTVDALNALLVRCAQEEDWVTYAH